MSKPERRRPFFLRPFFLITVLFLFVLAGIGAWFALEFIHKYEKKAAEFDLAKLDAVESASVIYDRYGQVFGKIFIQNREQVTLDQISPYLVDAVISEEDNRFYEHSGIARMIGKYWKSSSPSGSSGSSRRTRLWSYI